MKTKEKNTKTVAAKCAKRAKNKAQNVRASKDHNKTKTSDNNATAPTVKGTTASTGDIKAEKTNVSNMMVVDTRNVKKMACSAQRKKKNARSQSDKTVPTRIAAVGQKIVDVSVNTRHSVEIGTTASITKRIRISW